MEVSLQIFFTALALVNIINLQISLGKLTSDGIKVEKTNDKER